MQAEVGAMREARIRQLAGGCSPRGRSERQM